MGEVNVSRSGPLVTVQDQGRRGYVALGVARGGALDLCAAQVANLLVGNPPEAALLEITLGGLRLGFTESRRVAWCGGDFVVQVAGERIPAGRCAMVRRGEELAVENAVAGVRAWLAIEGGIDVPEVLGSKSTDLRSAFGGLEGRALRAGDKLSLGKSNAPAPEARRLAPWSAPAEWARTALPAPLLRIVHGAEWTEFTPQAQRDLLEKTFTVTTQADRMGVRLAGTELRRRKKRELISEAVVPGTIQVAHDGQPIVLLGDCQTIGGYPKIAHVITVDLARAAQLQPNDTVRFEEVSLQQAAALATARAHDLERFRVGLQLRA
ncbi:biotin-dependent carboxyltransferase family protein [soil metagenome]